MNINELVSMVFFCISTILSSIMWAVKRRKKNTVFTRVTPTKVFTIGFVISLSAYIFLSSVSDNIIALIDTGFVTFRNVKKYLKLDLSPSEFNQVISVRTTVSSIGRYYLTLLDLIIPLVTLRLVYSAFRDYLTQWTYFVLRWRRFHIFSELNEKTICLAEDIFNNEKKSSVIFANVSDKYADGLLDRAKRISAHFTKKTILDFSYLKRQHTVYIMSADDSKNMSAAIKLNELLNRKKVDADMFVLSSLDTSPEHIDAINLDKANEHCSVYLIDYAQIVSYNLLFDCPLFKAAELAHSRKISVLVIGAGMIGKAFAQASMWAGLMNKYDYEITVIDAEDREKEFYSSVGDINEKLRDVGVHINYKYELADVKSFRFKELLRDHYDANYIVIALGNDELTVNTSVTVRREMIRASVERGTYTGKNESIIIPIISDENYTSLVMQLGGDYGFTIYGSHQQIFRFSVIGYSRLDKVATYINRDYVLASGGSTTLSDEMAQYKRTSEINRRSSRAAAVRARYNLKEAGVDCSFGEECSGTEITTEQADAMLRATDLQELEHKRWSVFMTISGWDVWKLFSDDEYVSIAKFNKNVHKLSIAKLHGCLIENEKLDEISKVVPSTGKGDALRKNDTIVVNASANALKYAFEGLKFYRGEQEET